MSFPRYPNYKDSGVAWLGEVPGHWEMSRHKYVAVFSKGKNPTELVEEPLDGMLPYLSMEHLRGGQPATYSYPQSNSVVSSNGQVLVIWDGSNAGEFVRGKSGIVSSTMAASQIYRDFNSDYYWFYCQTIETEMRNHARGMGIPHVNGEELNRVVVPVPPPSEQQTIAAFLDRETGKIDALIAEQRRLVELLAEKRQAVISHAVTKGLGTHHSSTPIQSPRHSREGGNPAEPTAPRSGQSGCPAAQEFSIELDSRLRGNDGSVGNDGHVRMKDSGIEWLGDVPEHWELKRLKYLGEAITGLTYSPSDIVDDGTSGILVLRSSNIQGGVITFDDNVYVSAEIPKELVTQVGDILICSRNGSRALIGKNATVNQSSSGLTFGAFMTVFRSRHSAYLSWVLNSPLFEFQSGAFMTSTINQLTIGVLNNFEVPLPPENERADIAAYLAIESAKFDSLTAEANRAIALLQERRSALISAAVTGKIDVRHVGLKPDLRAATR